MSYEKPAMKWVRSAIRGMGYVPGYGHHPGNICLFAFMLLAAIAGDGFLGPLIVLAVYGPFYLWGAYQRGKVHNDGANNE